MAWKLIISQLSCQLFQDLKKILSSEATTTVARLKKSSFTRSRSLPIDKLLLFFLSNIRGSIKTELNNFGGQLKDSFIPIKFVTDAAFCKAKDKLNPEVFRHILNKIAEKYSKYAKNTWNGQRVLAIDGTLCRLPNEDELQEYFGVWKGNNNSARTMIRGTAVYDVLNRMTTDIIFTPKGVGERKGAKKLFDDMPDKSIILMDRGYPAYWLFLELYEKGHDFVIRAKQDAHPFFKRFWDSEETDIVINMPPSRQYMRDHKEQTVFKEIPLRLIKRLDKKGNPMVLATTILDKKYSALEIYKLYGLRWYAEENYKVLKSKLNVEHISSRKPNGILCDMYAKTLIMAFGQMLASELHNVTKKIKCHYKYEQKLNFSNFLSVLNRSFITLFKAYNLKRIIGDFIKVALEESIPIRNGRSYPRDNRVNIPVYYINYRPIS